MARKSRSANKAAGSTATQPLRPEEQVEQQVLTHFAKTVYFNDLWKSFLSKISGLVVLMSVVMIQRMQQSAGGVGFVAGFELLSLFTALATILFLRRAVDPVLAFKAAFLISLLQSAWFAHTTYRRRTQQPAEIGDLLPDQFPFGAMYFAFCWLSDRFMLRSHDQAKQNAEDVQAVLRKTQ